MTDDQRSPPGDSFLARRARLKAERQQAVREPISSPEQDAEQEVESPAPVAPPLTDADMPPVESLTEESDFSQFLAEGVSDVLRRTALRKLFHLPEFNILDGLNDYDEDYTKFEKLGDVVTYQQRRMQARDEAVKKAAAEKEAAEREASGLSEPAGEEEVITSQEVAIGEAAETGDGKDAAAPRNAITAADGEEIDDDGDLDA